MALKDLIAEFIGTYLLVLTVGCNVMSGKGTSAALSIAASLMVCIYALGSVSGAHFNPAVTLACYLNELLHGKKPSIGKVITYMVTQLVAGVLAGFSYLWLHGSAFALEPGDDFTWQGAGVVEVVYTCMLCFVVLRVCASETSKYDAGEYYGLAIGWVIVAGGYAGGWISKGCFNPAVALGVDVASAGTGIEYAFLYFGFEFAGATVAALLHFYVEKEPTDVGVGKGKSLRQKALSEFLGTFYLVFTVGLNILGQSPAPALSIAASLMCMIYALGGVSGAHFNPAVTCALTLAGKFDRADLGAYIGAQLGGGLSAGLAYTHLVGQVTKLEPGAHHTLGEAGFAEAIYTAVLCFVVLMVVDGSAPCMIANNCVHKRALPTMYGLAIGFTVVSGGFAIGAISGGSLNPAVSFGLAASHAHQGGSFTYCFVYAIFEVIGGVLAATAYTRIWPPDTCVWPPPPVKYEPLPVTESTPVTYSGGGGGGGGGGGYTGGGGGYTGGGSPVVHETKPYVKPPPKPAPSAPSPPKPTIMLRRELKLLLVYLLLVGAAVPFTTCLGGPPWWIYIIFVVILVRLQWLHRSWLMEMGSWVDSMGSWYRKWHDHEIVPEELSDATRDAHGTPLTLAGWRRYTKMSFVLVALGLLEGLDWLTNAAFAAQALACEPEITHNFAFSLHKSAVPWAAPQVTTFTFTGLVLLCFCWAGASRAWMAYWSLGYGDNGHRGHGVVQPQPGLAAWSLGMLQLRHDLSPNDSERAEVQMKGALRRLPENLLQLWLQSSFFMQTFAISSQYGKGTQLLSLTLAVISNISLFVGVMKNWYSFVTGTRWRRLAILTFCNPVPWVTGFVLVWTVLKIVYAFECDSHVWNLTSGCVPVQGS